MTHRQPCTQTALRSVVDAVTGIVWPRWSSERMEKVEGGAKKLEEDVKERQEPRGWEWTGGDSNPRPPPVWKSVLPRGWTPCCILPD